MTRTRALKLFLLSTALVFALHSAPSVSAAGTFAISPPSSNYIRSCTQTADITINVTSGQSNAADAIVTFDPTKIEIIDALPSLPGIQLLPGNAFESYAGNVVNNTTGEIKLVGYSSMSTLQGSATFATIYYKSKPLAADGAFTFTFTGANPYSTLDSNIADATTAYDMLSGVTGASYTFSAGSCATDTTPPTISFISPTNLANNVPSNATVTLKVSDSGSGISLPSLQIVINGIVYTTSSPEVTLTGTPSSYTLVVVPSNPFPTNATSVISVIVADTAGNQKSGNISINSNYSCPTTIVERPASCPATTPTPTSTATPQGPESPTILIESPVTTSASKPYTMIIIAQDVDGIAPESFLLQFGGQVFSLASTPERIKLTGSKERYVFALEFLPGEFVVTSEGTMVATIRVADLVGNTSYKTVVIHTTGKPVTLPPADSLFISAGTLLTWTTGIALLFFALFGIPVFIKSLQPQLLLVVNQQGNVIRFPRATMRDTNGTRTSLHGTWTGKVHGRYPHEEVTIHIQKYGFTTATVRLSPSIQHKTIRVVLSRL